MKIQIFFISWLFLTTGPVDKNKKQNKDFQTIMEIMWDFFVLPNFPSLQVKQSTIISNKQDVHEFPHELST